MIYVAKFRFCELEKNIKAVSLLTKLQSFKVVNDNRIYYVKIKMSYFKITTLTIPLDLQYSCLHPLHSPACFYNWKGINLLFESRILQWWSDLSLCSEFSSDTPEASWKRSFTFKHTKSTRFILLSYLMINLTFSNAQMINIFLTYGWT